VSLNSKVRNSNVETRTLKLEACTAAAGRRLQCALCAGVGSPLASLVGRLLCGVRLRSRSPVALLRSVCKLPPPTPSARLIARERTHLRPIALASRRGQHWFARATVREQCVCSLGRRGPGAPRDAGQLRRPWCRLAPRSPARRRRVVSPGYEYACWLSALASSCAAILAARPRHGACSALQAARQDRYALRVPTASRRVASVIGDPKSLTRCARPGHPCPGRRLPTLLGALSGPCCALGLRFGVTDSAALACRLLGRARTVPGASTRATTSCTRRRWPPRRLRRLPPGGGPQEDLRGVAQTPDGSFAARSACGARKWAVDTVAPVGLRCGSTWFTSRSRSAATWGKH